MIAGTSLDTIQDFVNITKTVRNYFVDAYGEEVADKIVVLDAGEIQLNDIPSRVFADKFLCDKLGIGQPETKITADLIGLDLNEDLTYSNFIKKLEKKYLAAHD